MARQQSTVHDEQRPASSASLLEQWSSRRSGPQCMQIVLLQLEQHRHALSQRPHSHSDDDVSNCGESTQWITTRTSYCPLSILHSLRIQHHCHSSNSLLIITSASLRLSYLSGPLFPHHHLSRPSSTVASSSSTTLHRIHTQSTAFCL